MRLLNVSLVAMLASTSLAGSDWRYCGGTVGGADAGVLFMDMETILKKKDTVRFWVNSIPQKQLIPFSLPDSNISNKIIADAQNKINKGYVPPFLMLPTYKSIRSDQEGFLKTTRLFVIFESDVRERRPNPTARYGVEINISKRMIRNISVTQFNENGECIASSEVPEEWQHLAPDTNTFSWFEFFSMPKFNPLYSKKNK